MIFLDPFISRFILVLIIAFIALSIYHIINHQDTTVKKAAWLFIVLTFPVLGSIIYFVNFSIHRKKLSQRLS